VDGGWEGGREGGRYLRLLADIPRGSGGTDGTDDGDTLLLEERREGGREGGMGEVQDEGGSGGREEGRRGGKGTYRVKLDGGLVLLGQERDVKDVLDGLQEGRREGRREGGREGGKGIR
jgi:hypothetical protein